MKKCVFYKHTMIEGILETVRMVHKIGHCPCISVKAENKARLRALEGCHVFSKGSSRVPAHDKGVVAGNEKEQYSPH